MKTELNIPETIYEYVICENQMLPEVSNELINQLSGLRGTIGHDRAEQIYSDVLTAIDGAAKAAFVLGWRMRGQA